MLNTKYQKNKIVITEIPFGIKKSNLVKSIELIAINKKIEGILEVVDQSNMNKLEIVIYLKNHANCDLIINYLLSNTSLAISYSCNYLVIDNNSPKRLSPKIILEKTILLHKNIYKKKKQIILSNKKGKLEIVNGILIVLDNIKRAIEIILKSSSREKARFALEKAFKLSEKQSDAITNLQLYRLTSNSKNELLEQKKLLNDEIQNIQKILNSKMLFDKEIEKIYHEMLKNLASSNRLSNIIKENIEHKKNITEKLKLIKLKDIYYIITADGFYLVNYSKIDINKKIVNDKNLKNEIIINNIHSNTSKWILLVTKKGLGLILNYEKLIINKFNHINKKFKIDFHNNEIIFADEIPLNNKDNSHQLIIVTKKGKVKKIDLYDPIINNKLNKKFKFLNTSKNDEIISILKLNQNDTHLFISTKLGYLKKYRYF